MLLVAVLLGLGFTFREPLEMQWKFLSARLFPCQTPITYSVGEFDTRFGISKESFLKAIREAEEVWETPIEKELFSYTPNGYLKVNLVYDDRQSTTQTLQKLGVKVEQSRASYEEIERTYEKTVSLFESSKSALESRIADFEERKSIYENDVRRANRQKNITKEEYERLSAEAVFLESEADALNRLQTQLRAVADDINALVGILNALADALNLDVARYNNIGDSLGGEFVQGVYESHGEGQGITVFQYDSYAKLVRVLAHELGHALSLEHMDNPEAIMYRLNEGDNDTVAPDDLFALKKHCGIE